MKKITFLLMMVLSSLQAKSQSVIRGTVVDDNTKLPISGATVSLSRPGVSLSTDQSGKFYFKGKFDSATTISVNSVGYAAKAFTLSNLNAAGSLSLSQKQILLEDVLVVSTGANHSGVISKTDIAMRGVNNSQEVLRIVPGLIIAQHQGGGKAEQLFLRGFDVDHGTDFRLDVDGIPINMPSHAHGQGFADAHFIIPETIEKVDFRKGTYNAAKGDFATTGFVDFSTKNTLSKNVMKLEGGRFDTWRALAMINLLNEKAKQKQQGWYVASEFNYSDSYFDNAQHFKRVNLFSKFTGKINSNTNIILSASTFWSKWNASGQIPNRAVESGVIGFFGTVDPFEGGLTSRSNFNAQLVTALNNGDFVKNQIYYSNAHFDLHSNFTFFLNDSVNGDQIRQKEARNLMGYNGSYTHSGYFGRVRVIAEAGVNFRSDFTKNTELSKTKNRLITLQQMKLGDISQFNIAAYLHETVVLNRHFSMSAGLRFDRFYHQYNNKLEGDSTLPGIGIYKAKANTVSPKLNFYYQMNDQTQFYLTAGKGFHSNDSRSVVVRNGKAILPSAYGTDVGTIFKPAGNLILNAALWYIYLQQEFVYVGDGGNIEFNGRTRRYGFDFSARYQPIKSLYVDLDLNYAHARAIGPEKGNDLIPLAPIFTSTGGVTYHNKNGLNGSLRYRHIGGRPGNENNSLTAEGYLVTDAVIGYTKPKYEVGLLINNLLNTRWKETQFATETRLKNEPAPVDEICFTAGTPLSAKLVISCFFK